MLTRLEVDGFKNLRGLVIEFGPFTCIAGPNGVGKSNIFDVITFLSLLADHDIQDAALMIRKSSGNSGIPKDMTADMSDLFRRRDGGGWEDISIAAEMIINPSVKDDFNRVAEASSTFLRYELVLGYVLESASRPFGGIELKAERLDYIKAGDARAHMRFPHSPSFRNSIIWNKRKSQSGYISTFTDNEGVVEIHVHQDGGSSGQPQKAPAEAAPRTILSTTTTSTTPTVLAARREMQGWKLLALEPSSMRAASRFHTEPHVSLTGENLPATLYRLVQLNEGESDICSEIASRLNELVRVESVDVIRDDTRQIFSIEITEKDGPVVPARSLSDGTLRILALSILEADKSISGLVCMEEPENGIHPGNMPVMQNLLQDLSVDCQMPVGPDNPMRQMIVATHSPRLVALQSEDDLLYAFRKKVARGETVGEALVCLPLHDTWRCSSGEPSIGFSMIHHYLTLPDDRQLQLPRIGRD